MTTKKLSRQQVRWTKFLSRFNFDISYTPGWENRITDLLTCWPNNYLVNDHDDLQQNLLQTIFPPERLEISSIDLNESETIPEKVIQAKLTDFYYIKLCKIISTHSLTESINTHHLSDLSIDTRGCIRRLNYFWVPKHLQLMVIRKIHDQIATSHPGF